MCKVAFFLLLCIPHGIVEYKPQNNHGKWSPAAKIRKVFAKEDKILLQRTVMLILSSKTKMQTCFNCFITLLVVNIYSTVESKELTQIGTLRRVLYKHRKKKSADVGALHLISPEKALPQVTYLVPGVQ